MKHASQALRQRRMSRLVAGLVLSGLSLLATLGCSLESLYLTWYLESHAQALETPAGTDATPVELTVTPGMGVSEIAAALYARGLISDAELFRRYVQSRGWDTALQAGTYSLQATMTIPEIALILAEGKVAEQKVTIPEGRRLEEVAALLEAQASIPAADFIAFARTGWHAADWAARYSFLADLPAEASLEGYLFPETYRLPLHATATDAVELMVAQFDTRVTPDLRAAFADQGLSLHQAVTLASIVEREAVLDAERPVIASVYYNRLRAGWTLSACPTVQYALGYRADEATWWKPQLYYSDLEVDSPYNTYRHVGLPPGPIASPGLASLQAVAYPATTDYFFFMVECDHTDGSHVFARTEEEHMANFARCGGGIISP